MNTLKLYAIALMICLIGGQCIAQETSLPTNDPSKELAIYLDTLDGAKPKQEKNYLRIKELIEEGADVNTVSSTGLTPLFLLSNTNEIELISYLIDNGADVNLALDMSKAFESKKWKLSNEKLKTPIDTTKINENFMLPLYSALISNNTEVAKILIEKGAKYYTSFETNYHPLAIVVAWGDVELIKMLLSEINQFKYSQRFMQKVLISVTFNGKSRMVKLLLEGGVNPNLDGDFIPVVIAAQKGYVDIIFDLIAAGADINQSSKSGAPALFYAAQNNNIYLLKELIRLGANVDLKSKTIPTSPIYIAAQNGHIDIVRTLIEAKADINTKSPMTPLVAAIMHKHIEIVRELLKADAEMLPSPNGSLFVLNNAVSRHKPEILKLILNHLIKKVPKEELLKMINITCKGKNSRDADKELQCIQFVKGMM